MTARRTSTLSPVAGTVAPVDIDTTRSHVAAAALRPSAIGTVGLELEFHVVDPAAPGRRPTWDEVTRLVSAVGRAPQGSALTVEPGGQLELSGPPMQTVGAAITGLQADERAVRDAAADLGLALAPIGADPARALGRVTPQRRYVSMEEHFTAIGCGRPGRQMMSSTAALQVNLDAGPAEHWADRVGHVHTIGPVLSAMSACSPMIAGYASGWASMREQAWRGIDRARTAPVRRSADPAQAWAEYALRAPVMLVRDGDGALPVRTRVTLDDWVRKPALIGRPPTIQDVDYHLTTLFPPVRLRGYLELRFLDAVPDAWWPALAAIVTALIDDPVAADLAAEACTAVVGAWPRAARSGLADPALREAAQRCVAIAAARCPGGLRPDVEAYAELVHHGRTPGDALRARIDAVGAATALAEAAAQEPAHA